MENKKKSGALSFLGGILVIALVIVYFAGAVINIFKLSQAKDLPSDLSELQRKEFVSGETHYGSKLLLTMKHTFNYIIPMGKEYYYCVYSDDTDTVSFVRAGKKFGDNFNNDSYSSSAVKIKGKVREADSQVKRELSTAINQLESNGFKIAKDSGNLLFIDTQTTFQSMLRISSCLALLASIIIFLLIANMKKQPIGEVQRNTSVPSAIAIILFIAGMVIMLYTFSFL